MNYYLRINSKGNFKGTAANISHCFLLQKKKLDKPFKIHYMSMLCKVLDNNEEVSL